MEENQKRRSLRNKFAKKEKENQTDEEKTPGTQEGVGDHRGMEEIHGVMKLDSRGRKKESK